MLATALRRSCGQPAAAARRLALAALQPAAADRGSAVVCTSAAATAAAEYAEWRGAHRGASWLSSLQPTLLTLSHDLHSSASVRATHDGATSSGAGGGHAAPNGAQSAGAGIEGGDGASGGADELRERLLDAALELVPALGWSQAALQEAARQLGMSPALAGIVPGGEAGLVQHFVDRCNDRLAEELEALRPQLDGLRVRERVAAGVKLRLQMLAPVIDTWHQALAIQAQPANAPRALQQLGEAVDEIWVAAGDTSTDHNWYTKRALLGGVFVATELYMLTDGSPDYADTWDALERLIDEVMQAGRALGQAGSAAQSLLHGLGGALAQLLRQPHAPRTPPSA